MARIPLPTPDTLTDEQRRVHDLILSGPRKALVGPLLAALHQPALAEVWAPFGAFVRYQTSLPPRLCELAILVTARRWTSQVEWHIHAEVARRAGLQEAVIEAIRLAQPPTLEDPDEALVYEITRLLQTTGQIPSEHYQRATARFGIPGVVELTTVIGYYTLVSITLNAHEIPLPDGSQSPLAPIAGTAAQSLVELPPAVCADAEVRQA